MLQGRGVRDRSPDGAKGAPRAPPPTMKGVIGILALLFLVVPIIELYVIVQVAQGIGVLETIALLLGISIIGAWLVKVQGLAAIARVQQSLMRAEAPTNPLVDGALTLFAAALLLTPGFVTDGVGLLMLFPPTRVVFRRPVVRALSKRVRAGRARIVGFGSPGSVADDVIDLDPVRDAERRFGRPPREGE